MRISFFLTYYYPHWTGLTQYAQRLAEGLAQRGWEVSVLTSRPDEGLEPREQVNGVTVIRLNPLVRLSRSVVQSGFLSTARRLIEKNDVVVCFLPFPEVLLAAFLCRLLNKRLFLVHNGDLVLPEGLINRVIEGFYYVTTAMSIKLSERIIVQTEDYARESKLLNKFRDKWAVVLPLYPPEFEHVSPNNAHAKDQEPGTNPGPRIGFAGRFVEEKGFDYLLQAIPLVVKKFPQAQFVFAGESKIFYENFYEKNLDLINKYQGHLNFLGLLRTQQQMIDFYRSLDVFVVSSRTDCFPSTQVEAMLCGTPVVCTDIPGARWVVRETGMGVLVKPRSPEHLAGGIIEVLQNRENYLTKRGNSEEVFSYEKTLNAYEALFRKRS